VQAARGHPEPAEVDTMIEHAPTASPGWRWWAWTVAPSALGLISIGISLGGNPLAGGVLAACCLARAIWDLTHV
jgi:hypothetical protein